MCTVDTGDRLLLSVLLANNESTERSSSHSDNGLGEHTCSSRRVICIDIQPQLVSRDMRQMEQAIVNGEFWLVLTRDHSTHIPINYRAPNYTRDCAITATPFSTWRSTDPMLMTHASVSSINGLSISAYFILWIYWCFCEHFQFLYHACRCPL